jgi:hypothetical protein
MTMEAPVAVWMHRNPLTMQATGCADALDFIPDTAVNEAKTARGERLSMGIAGSPRHEEGKNRRGVLSVVEWTLAAEVRLLKLSHCNTPVAS